MGAGFEKTVILKFENLCQKQMTDIKMYDLL